MAKEAKPMVAMEDTFDKLDIRLGRIVKVEEAEGVPKRAYKLTIDFGKFGMKTSIGRFTQHASDEIVGRLVLGVLNFESRMIGHTQSEVLTLGVQYPKAESGEATLVSPLADAKVGSKLF